MPDFSQLPQGNENPITTLFCRFSLELVHACMSDLLRLLLNYLTDVKDLVALSGTNREWRAAIAHCPVSVTIAREVPWNRFMAWITAQAPHTVSLRVSHCDVDDAGAHTICYDVITLYSLKASCVCAFSYRYAAGPACYGDARTAGSQEPGAV